MTASKFSLRLEAVEVGFVKGQPVVTGARGAGPGGGKRLAGVVDAENRPGRADHFGCDHRDVADAAADVEDPHAGLRRRRGAALRGSRAEISPCAQAGQFLSEWPRT